MQQHKVFIYVMQRVLLRICNLISFNTDVACIADKTLQWYSILSACSASTHLHVHVVDKRDAQLVILIASYQLLLVSLTCTCSIVQ